MGGDVVVDVGVAVRGGHVVVDDHYYVSSRSQYSKLLLHYPVLHYYTNASPKVRRS